MCVRACETSITKKQASLTCKHKWQSIKHMHAQAHAHSCMCTLAHMLRTLPRALMVTSTLQASCRALHKVCAHEREPSPKLTNMRVPPKSTFPNEFWYMSKLYFELEWKVMSSNLANLPSFQRLSRLDQTMKRTQKKSTEIKAQTQRQKLKIK